MNSLIILSIVIAFVAAVPIDKEFVTVNQDSHGNFNYKVLTENSKIEQLPLLRVAEIQQPVVSKIVKIPEVPLVRKSVEIPEVSLVKSEIVQVPSDTSLLRSEIVEVPQITSGIKTEFDQVPKVKTELPFVYRTVPVHYVESPTYRYVIPGTSDYVITQSGHTISN